VVPSAPIREVLWLARGPTSMKARACALGAAACDVTYRRDLTPRSHVRAMRLPIRAVDETPQGPAISITAQRSPLPDQESAGAQTRELTTDEQAADTLRRC